MRRSLHGANLNAVHRWSSCELGRCGTNDLVSAKSRCQPHQDSSNSARALPVYTIGLGSVNGTVGAVTPLAFNLRTVLFYPLWLRDFSLPRRHLSLIFYVFLVAFVICVIRRQGTVCCVMCR